MFGQKFKLEIEIFAKKHNLGENLKFWSLVKKIITLVKNRSFKSELRGNKINFGQNVFLYFAIAISAEKVDVNISL